MGVIPFIDDDIWKNVITKSKWKLSSDLERNYLSWSKLMQYVGCPKSYEYQYIDGVPSAPSATMAFGIAAHKAFEHANTYLMRTKKKPHVNEVVGAAIEKFEKIQGEGGGINFGMYETTEDLEKREIEDVARFYCDSECGLNAHMHSEIIGVENELRVLIMPNAQILSPEQFDNEDLLKDCIPFIGRLDLIEKQSSGDISIIDFKTSIRSSNQNTVDTSGQLSFYAGPIGATQVELHIVLRRTKKMGPRWQKGHPLVSSRSSNHYKALVPHIYDAVNSISKGDFPTMGYLRKGMGDWKCNPKYCSYYNECVGQAEQAWNITL